MPPPKKPYQTGVTLGCVLMFAPLIGLLLTVIGMQRSFAALGNQSIQEPQVLAHDIGQMLNSTAIGLGLGLAGVLTLIVSLVLRFSARPDGPPPVPPASAP